MLHEAIGTFYLFMSNTYICFLVSIANGYVCKLILKQVVFFYESHARLIEVSKICFYVIELGRGKVGFYVFFVK